NDPVNTQRPSARTNNGSNNSVNRQLSERRNDISTQQPSSVNRRGTVRSQTQQPAVRSSQRSAPNTISERSQPVRRNVQQVRPSSSQRVERSSNNRPSGRREGNRGSRSSGSSEPRARRG